MRHSRPIRKWVKCDAGLRVRPTDTATVIYLQSLCTREATGKSTTGMGRSIFNAKVVLEDRVPRSRNLRLLRPLSISERTCRTGGHYKHVERKGQHACFITKEDIDAKGSFQTGLTVNMILLSHLKTGISAYQYAQQFIRTATGEREPLKSWSSTQGPFKAHGCIIRDDSGGPPVFVYNLIIANDRTGTVYVVLYEAPEAEWDEAWKIGEPILKELIILDDSDWLQPVRDEPIPVV